MSRQLSTHEPSFSPLKIFQIRNSWNKIVPGDKFRFAFHYNWLPQWRLKCWGGSRRTTSGSPNTTFTNWIGIISRTLDKFACSEVYNVLTIFSPELHPFEAEREYQRALNAVKLERTFAKPFVGSLDGHRDSLTHLAKHPKVSLHVHISLTDVPHLVPVHTDQRRRLGWGEDLEPDLQDLRHIIPRPQRGHPRPGLHSWRYVNTSMLYQR